jgi:hypothetical protein
LDEVGQTCAEMIPRSPPENFSFLFSKASTSAFVVHEFDPLLPLNDEISAPRSSLVFPLFGKTNHRQFLFGRISFGGDGKTTSSRFFQ